MSNFTCNNNSVQKSVIKSSKFPFIFPVRGSALPFEKVEQVTRMCFFFAKHNIATFDMELTVMICRPDMG